MEGEKLEELERALRSQLSEEKLTTPIYSEHDAGYYEECLANLREKGIELE